MELQVFSLHKQTHELNKVSCFGRLAARAGTRPLAISFDDLDRSWTTAASALLTAFPALVRRRFVAPWNPLSDDDQEFLHEGGIILDKDHFASWGIWLCQDPLHVYFRLIESLDWRSWDAAWAVRSARKLLQSWTQVHNEVEDYATADMRADFQDEICAVRCYVNCLHPAPSLPPIPQLNPVLCYAIASELFLGLERFIYGQSLVLYA